MSLSSLRLSPSNMTVVQSLESQRIRDAANFDAMIGAHQGLTKLWNSAAMQILLFK